MIRGKKTCAAPGGLPAPAEVGGKLSQRKGMYRKSHLCARRARRGWRCSARPRCVPPAAQLPHSRAPPSAAPPPPPHLQPLWCTPSSTPCQPTLRRCKLWKATAQCSILQAHHGTLAEPKRCPSQCKVLFGCNRARCPEEPRRQLPQEHQNITAQRMPAWNARATQQEERWQACLGDACAPAWRTPPLLSHLLVCLQHSMQLGGCGKRRFSCAGTHEESAQI